jgi:hypothetical protein
MILLFGIFLATLGSFILNFANTCLIVNDDVENDEDPHIGNNNITPLDSRL